MFGWRGESRSSWKVLNKSIQLTDTDEGEDCSLMGKGLRCGCLLKGLADGVEQNMGFLELGHRL